MCTTLKRIGKFMTALLVTGIVVAGFGVEAQASTLKRLALELEHDGTLSEAEQAALRDDAAGIVDGDGIDGFMSVGDGHSWLEMEGESTAVENAASEVAALSSVSSTTTRADHTIGSRSLDHWFGVLVSDTQVIEGMSGGSNLNHRVMKLTFGSTLSPEEQEDFIVKVSGIVDGDGLDGYMSVGDGHSWLELEGNDSDVEAVLEEIMELQEVEFGTTEADYAISQRVYPDWYGTRRALCVEKN